MGHPDSVRSGAAARSRSTGAFELLVPGHHREQFGHAAPPRDAGEHQPAPDEAADREEPGRDRHAERHTSVATMAPAVICTCRMMGAPSLAVAQRASRPTSSPRCRRRGGTSLRRSGGTARPRRANACRSGSGRPHASNLRPVGSRRRRRTRAAEAPRRRSAPRHARSPRGHQRASCRRLPSTTQADPVQRRLSWPSREWFSRVALGYSHANIPPLRLTTAQPARCRQGSCYTNERHGTEVRPRV
jgi:hypothetical protein